MATLTLRQATSISIRSSEKVEDQQFSIQKDDAATSHSLGSIPIRWMISKYESKRILESAVVSSMTQEQSHIIDQRDRSLFLESDMKWTKGLSNFCSGKIRLRKNLKPHRYSFFLTRYYDDVTKTLVKTLTRSTFTCSSQRIKK